MPKEGKRGRFRRAERWASVEWIIVRPRLFLLLILLLGLAIAVAIRIAFAVGVSHLSHSELHSFLHRQSLYPRGREGPILERVTPGH